MESRASVGVGTRRLAAITFAATLTWGCLGVPDLPALPDAAPTADAAPDGDAEPIDDVGPIADGAPSDGAPSDAAPPADGALSDACAPADEACNGADDDCDGIVDEDTFDCDRGCDDIDDDGDGRTDEGCARVRCAGRMIPPCNGASDVEVEQGWVYIPAGEFSMGGAPEHDPGLYESPQLRVRIEHPFVMQRYEVTQSDWAARATDDVGARPSADDGADEKPVERVNWFEAAWYANALSAGEGRPTCYDAEVLALCSPMPGAGCPADGCYPVNDRAYRRPCLERFDDLFVFHPARACPGYRLPDESEWEHAARAGTTGIRYFDPDPADGHAWAGVMQTQPVGGLAPNPWGLFDMHGNVAEWTQDALHVFPPPLVAPVVDFEGPLGGFRNSVRGGGYQTAPADLRTFGRGLRDDTSPYPPDWRGRDIGFRLVRSLQPDDPAALPRVELAGGPLVGASPGTTTYHVFPDEAAEVIAQIEEPAEGPPMGVLVIESPRGARGRVIEFERAAPGSFRAEVSWADLGALPNDVDGDDRDFTAIAWLYTASGRSTSLHLQLRFQCPGGFIAGVCMDP